MKNLSETLNQLRDRYLHARPEERRSILVDNYCIQLDPRWTSMEELRFHLDQIGSHAVTLSGLVIRIGVDRISISELQQLTTFYCLVICAQHLQQLVERETSLRLSPQWRELWDLFFRLLSVIDHSHDDPRSATSYIHLLSGASYLLRCAASDLEAPRHALPDQLIDWLRQLPTALFLPNQATDDLLSNA